MIVERPTLHCVLRFDVQDGATCIESPVAHPCGRCQRQTRFFINRRGETGCWACDVRQAPESTGVLMP